jgi:hypothetical protein
VVERFTVNLNQLFLIEPPLRTQLQVNGINTYCGKVFVYYSNQDFACCNVDTIHVIQKRSLIVITNPNSPIETVSKDSITQRNPKFY